MKIYLICPVRAADPAHVAACADWADQMRGDGHEVHFPITDVAQDDPTGAAICAAHLTAMRAADVVHVFWDVNSKGSHFDLGMAYALGKPVLPLQAFAADAPGKSYWKAMNAWVAA